MTAIPEALPLELAEPTPAAANDDALSAAGRLYVLALVGLAAGAGGALYLSAVPARPAWSTFAVLTAAAAIAQAFPVKSPRNVMYHTSVVFLVAAALLLPPQLLLLIPLVQTIPEWLRERYPWPVQGFTIANYTLATIAAWGAADVVARHAAALIAESNPRLAAAGLAACLAFIAVNQLLIAGMLWIGRRRSLGGRGLFSLEGVSVDFVLTVLGVSLAT